MQVPSWRKCHGRLVCIACQAWDHGPGLVWRCSRIAGRPDMREPWRLERDLAEALDPARFHLRDLRRSEGRA